jgi:hypothetical protein
VRTLTENGFPRDAALASLTTQPAELLGVDRHFGWLKPGHSAQLALWTKHPLEKEAQVKWIIVDGFAEEFEIKETPAGKPDEGVDVTGTWEVETRGEDDSPGFILELKMDAEGKVTGSATSEAPIGGRNLNADVRGSVTGKTVTLEISITVEGTQIDISLTGEIDGDEMDGDQTMKFGGQEQESRFEAKRRPADGREGGR